MNKRIQTIGAAKNAAVSRTATSSRVSTSDEYLTDSEVAGILSIEPRTLRLWRVSRGLPHIRITSKAIRYKRGDLEQWLANRRVA